MGHLHFLVCCRILFLDFGAPCCCPTYPVSCLSRCPQMLWAGLGTMSAFTELFFWELAIWEWMGYSQSPLHSSLGFCHGDLRDISLSLWPKEGLQGELASILFTTGLLPLEQCLACWMDIHGQGPSPESVWSEGTHVGYPMTFLLRAAGRLLCKSVQPSKLLVSCLQLPQC